MKTMRLKSATAHEELEKLTTDYLAAGNKIRYCAPKKRRGETSASAREGEREKREQSANSVHCAEIPSNRQVHEVLSRA
jgi:hypothetical protein